MHTYHCNFCSHLLVASTHRFSELPTRRAPPGLDRAIIVPFRDASDTLLLTLQRDRRLKVITREDGFERRALFRCGRCRLVVAYQLDTGKYLYVLPGAVVETAELGNEGAGVGGGLLTGVDGDLVMGGMTAAEGGV